MQRVFLGWDRPALESTVDYLLARYTRDGRVDMRDVLLAVPGARAGRRLEERLIGRVESVDPSWFPPTIMTIGRLPERFYEAKHPFASDFVQQLAWIRALESIDPDRRAEVVPSAPEADDLGGWLALARMLATLHRELAAEGFSFHEVADCGARLAHFHEAERWATLAELQARYLETLDSLELWDLQTARLFAIRQGECVADMDVLLLGAADLNRQQRQILDQIGERATALVFAPESEADCFDEYGCLNVSAWLTRRIDIAEEQIVRSGSPSDQADDVARWLASLGDRYAASEITIGVPDAELIPYVEQRLAEADLDARYGVGVSIDRTAAYRLLRAVASHLEADTFASLAALARQPCLSKRLGAKLGDRWLADLDAYHEEHLPRALDPKSIGRSNRANTLREILAETRSLLAPLLEAPSSRPLPEWGPAILDVAASLLGERPLDPRIEADRETLHVCDALSAAARDFRAIPESMAPRVTAAEAVRLLLREVDGTAVAAPPNPDAIEMLGWLELPLDDAPALVITTLNEGRTPSAINADQFLPNQLRKALGVEDNDRRYARDAYALAMTLASRPDVRLIVGRRTAVGDPLLPSRLLFACDDDTLARRAKRLFEETAPRPRVRMDGATAPRVEAAFHVPRPIALKHAVTSMRVTEFRDYLACPYRYYLRRQLRLDALSDRSLELDGAAFGSLAHDALCEFGLSDIRDSQDPAAIREFLGEALDRKARERYGRRATPAAAVQIEQLRRRLDALADWQAAWRASGWRIEHVEVAPEDGTAFLQVDDSKMGLRGRIDRIDVHVETGEHIVFDYKTSDSAKKPEAAHRKGGDWIDLQLPLYRHLLAGLGLPDTAALGYIVLPKDVSKVGHLVASWDDAALAEADEAARTVVRGIWAEEFPKNDTPPPFSEAYAAICQDYRYGEAGFADDADEAA